MDLYSTVTGKTITSKDKESISGAMANSIKESGKIISLRGLVYLSGINLMIQKRLLRVSDQDPKMIVLQNKNKKLRNKPRLI